MAKIKVAVEVVPLAGKTTEKNVELEATGATVGEVLKKADINPTNMTVRVDGKDASPGDHVPNGSKIMVTERPQGS